jgi:hypothetical protein
MPGSRLTERLCPRYERLSELDLEELWHVLEGVGPVAHEEGGEVEGREVAS